LHMFNFNSIEFSSEKLFTSALFILCHTKEEIVSGIIGKVKVKIKYNNRHP